MKIILFGKNGQVGWELNQLLQPLGEIIALGREQTDFSIPQSLREVICDYEPDVIINAVAYTAVDKAESEEELATTINGVAPGILAEEAMKINALLIHYSTDYVFDGSKDEAYIETDSPCPINAYGRSKLVGEQVVQASGCDFLIFRTAWVYANRGHNFLLTIQRLARERQGLSIVGDQYGSPTSARLIAETTVDCIKQSVLEKKAGDFSSGIYHLTASGYTSWFGFAEEIVNQMKMLSDQSLKTKSIAGIASAEYPTPAARPFNSRLSVSKLEHNFNLKLPDWAQALSRCMGTIYIR